MLSFDTSKEDVLGTVKANSGIKGKYDIKRIKIQSVSQAACIVTNKYIFACT